VAKAGSFFSHSFFNQSNRIKCLLSSSLHSEHKFTAQSILFSQELLDQMLEFATMSKPRLFIDGHVGTTGLRIRHWLAGRGDVEVRTLNEEDRKSEAARRNAIRESDLSILCLPDDAARVAAKWGMESNTRILDASSSHRVEDGWVYGLPELVPGHRNEIRDAHRVTNPGCYPSSFILLVRPLVDAGLLPADAPMSVHALSGYSGGGKSSIKRWESADTGLQGHLFEAPYAVDRIHKHIPEMQRYSGLLKAPQFLPAVGPFACGMRVQVPIHQSLLVSGVTGQDAWNALAERYRGRTVHEWRIYRRVESRSDRAQRHQSNSSPRFPKFCRSSATHRFAG
jgi:N-acetyl-gamma-glutamyl-phosphate reductase